MKEKSKTKISGLYVLTDMAGNLEQRAEAVLKGGANIIQYRAKHLPEQEQLAMAKRLQFLCRQAGALFIVNDNVELARLSAADGVHLGQDDGSVAQARSVLGTEKIIGVSTHSMAEAFEAQQAGADYIGFGCLFPTKTKQDTKAVSLADLEAVTRAMSIPVVAIGGIDARRADEALRAGADSVAVISAVMQDGNPGLAAKEISLLFNRNKRYPHGRVLSVAGSDSGGGAGMQGDLKTIALLGAYGLSALTAVTAQNSCGVREIFPLPVNMVRAQMTAVLTDMGADVIKTGMLHSAEIVEAVAGMVRNRACLTVVDPVMAAKDGRALLASGAVAALREALLPLAYLVTPNLAEAEFLIGEPVRNEEEMAEAASRIHQSGARNVLVKGGHLPGAAIDLLYDGRQFFRFAGSHLPTRHTHGTGCALASAISVFLSQGVPLVAAVEKAKVFITRAIQLAGPFGVGHGSLNHLQAAQALRKSEI